MCLLRAFCGRQARALWRPSFGWRSEEQRARCGAGGRLLAGGGRVSAAGRRSGRTLPRVLFVGVSSPGRTFHFQDTCSQSRATRNWASLVPPPLVVRRAPRQQDSGLAAHLPLPPPPRSLQDQRTTPRSTMAAEAPASTPADGAAAELCDVGLYGLAIMGQVRSRPATGTGSMAATGVGFRKVAAADTQARAAACWARAPALRPRPWHVETTAIDARAATPSQDGNLAITTLVLIAAAAATTSELRPEHGRARFQCRRLQPLGPQGSYLPLAGSSILRRSAIMHS